MACWRKQEEAAQVDRARCAAPRLACLQLGRGTAAPQPSPPPTQSVPMQSELNVIPVALLRGCTRHTTSCCGISAESRRFAGCSVGVTRSGLTQNRGPAAGWRVAVPSCFMSRWMWRTRAALSRGRPGHISASEAFLPSRLQRKMLHLGQHCLWDSPPSCVQPWASMRTGLSSREDARK